jgi:hypothetical protein
MAPVRIYADFNNLDDFNRLRLNCAGTVDDLNRLGIVLQEGLTLTFSMDDADDRGQPDDLLVEGVVHYSEEAQSWVAVVDWSAVGHASDVTNRNGGVITAPISRQDISN